MEVPVEFVKFQRSFKRYAIAGQVQVAVAEIDQPFPLQIGDVGVSHVPLIGNGPVIALRSGRDFNHLEGCDLLQSPECLTHAIAGQAPADREQLPQQGIGFDSRRSQGKSWNKNSPLLACFACLPMVQPIPRPDVSYASRRH